MLNYNNTPTKIAIHSVPRSGSSWLGQIFNSSPQVNYKFQPLFSYKFKSYLDENSSKDKINDFFIKISRSSDDFLLQKENILSGKYPSFLKYENYKFTVYKEVRYHYILDNMLHNCQDLKLICIIRNPLAVMQDWLNSPKEFRKDLGWIDIEEWRYAPKKNMGRAEEFFGYEKWKESTQLFELLKQKYPTQVYLIEYNDLIKETLKEVENVFNFCNIKIENQTHSFLSESRAINDLDPYSVFKKVTIDNAWIHTLNSQIVDEVFHDLKYNPLKKYLSL